jgi:drug/metabolite transporter (DMT)-like permease
VRNSEREGLLIAACGFSTFSFGEAIVKSMASQWPALAAGALRFCIAAIVLGILVLVKEGLGAFRMPRPGLQLMRGSGIAIGTSAFFYALFALPMAEATSILFASPMFTALMAAVVLGEPVRKATWIAIGIAFCGVLLIVRPNFSLYGWALAWPVLAAMGVSMLIIGNRIGARLASGLAMQFYASAIGASLLTLATIFFAGTGIGGFVVGWPSMSVVLRCAIVAFTATSGHWLVYTATTRAGAALIAPMTYIQLLIALTLGLLIFGDWPDELSLAGAGLIVCAGLILWREGRATELAQTDAP